MSALKEIVELTYLISCSSSKSFIEYPPVDSQEGVVLEMVLFHLYPLSK